MALHFHYKEGIRLALRLEAALHTARQRPNTIGHSGTDRNGSAAVRGTPGKCAQAALWWPASTHSGYRGLRGGTHRNV